MPSFFPAARENIAVPDNRKGQIVFKWPDLNIRRFSNAIVAPDALSDFSAAFSTARPESRLTA